MKDQDIALHLQHIVDHHGIEIIEAPLRLEGMLRDFCPDQKLQIELILIALRLQIVRDLKRMPTPLSSENINSLSQRLQQEKGYAENYAFWAVSAWVLALQLPLAHTSPSKKSLIPPKSLHDSTTAAPKRKSSPTSIQQQKASSSSTARSPLASSPRTLRIISTLGSTALSVVSKNRSSLGQRNTPLASSRIASIARDIVGTCILTTLLVNAPIPPYYFIFVLASGVAISRVSWLLIELYGNRRGKCVLSLTQKIMTASALFGTLFMLLNAILLYFVSPQLKYINNDFAFFIVKITVFYARDLLAVFSVIGFVNGILLGIFLSIIQHMTGWLSGRAI